MTHTSMDRLRERLAAAHRSTSAATEPVDDRWQQGLMRSVRRIGPLKGERDNRTRFGQLAWRLAPAAVALMIAMAVLIVRIDNTLEYQVAGLLVNDPVQTYVIYNPF